MGRSIILCGYTGSGKSTVGRILASMLNLSFMDTDQLIEERFGLSITELVNDKGAEAFRDIEHEIALEVSESEDCVIATGGGLMTFERNYSLFNGKAIVVYIKRNFEQCYGVLQAHPERPIFRNNTKEELRARYDARVLIYSSIADIEIENSGIPRDTAVRIIQAIDS